MVAAVGKQVAGREPFRPSWSPAPSSVGSVRESHIGDAFGFHAAALPEVPAGKQVAFFFQCQLGNDVLMFHLTHPFSWVSLYKAADAGP